MIDRHLIEQMDNALSMREARGLCTNEQALLAFLQFGASASSAHVLANANYFRGEPLSYDGHLPSCWINPKGGFYTVEYGGHSSFAAKLGVCDDLLNRGGWIHVSDGRADDYFGRWTAGQRAVVNKFGFAHRDCSQWASSRLADDGKDAKLRGLEFRQRDGWDWRTDGVKDSGTMFAPLPGEAVEKAYRESCRDRAYQDDIAF